MERNLHNLKIFPPKPGLSWQNMSGGPCTIKSNVEIKNNIGERMTKANTDTRVSKILFASGYGGGFLNIKVIVPIDDRGSGMRII
jgi:hypothetical protein